MKKIFAMAVALIAAVTVQAQDLTDNYQKIYAGWMNLTDYISGADAASGFNVGYAYGINITGHNKPLFLEVGAEYSYLKKEEFKDNTLQIPLNITWKFGNENFSVAPYVGEALRIHMSTKIGDQDVFDFDKSNRVQAALNLGVNFTIKNCINIGYRYQLSEMKLVDQDGCKNDMTNNVTIGYVF